MLMFAEMINNSVATEATMCPGKHNLDRAVPRDADGADGRQQNTLRLRPRKTWPDVRHAAGGREGGMGPGQEEGKMINKHQLKIVQFCGDHHAGRHEDEQVPGHRQGCDDVGQDRGGPMATLVK